LLTLVVLTVLFFGAPRRAASCLAALELEEGILGGCAARRQRWKGEVARGRGLLAAGGA
jgi:hypothetical protein